MKRLNKKGFTLVELLAVIIILAIVVGITIPAVLTTTNKAKEKAFDTAASEVANWFDRQYPVAVTQLSSTGIATLDSNFQAVCSSNGSTCAPSTPAWVNANSVISAAGLNPNNVETLQVYINPSTGRSCVKLTAKANGDYANGSEVLTARTTTGCGANLS